MTKQVTILGAGAVGVAAAWALRQRGWRVLLIDRRLPASETSYGNAGIVSGSAALPFNNPLLPRQLPGLMIGSGAALDWQFSYLAANLPWFMRYLWHCRRHSALARARHLQRLIARGRALHQEWLERVEKAAHLRAGGWLKLYRSEESFSQAAAERDFWSTLEVEHQIIPPEEIAGLMPAATSVFARAVLISQAFAIVNPGAVIRAYADAFVADGGEFLQEEVGGMTAQGGGWRLHLKNGEVRDATQVVVALGPWCGEFLRPLGLALPLAFERGAHRHFELAAGAVPLPFADVDGGYNAVMQEDALRMTSGVYLAALQAPPPLRQLAAAEANLRQAVDGIGNSVGEEWFGARPTLPDALPVIGECRQRGLWLAGGCQHIGLMSSPAVGECVAQLLNGDAPLLEAAAFSPQRFGL